MQVPQVRIFGSGISAYGNKWKEVNLAMFTVYIDDSGTDPKQAVAIASAVIIPAKRIVALDSEWASLAAKEGFTDFHTSVCIAKNPKSEFANWDDDRTSRVAARIRQILRKYGTKAFSFAVNKVDYDEVVPSEIKEVGGKYHYTWAIRNVVSALDRWAEHARMTIPFEYVFDWMDKKSQGEAKAEVEIVLAQAESVNPHDPGRYTNYSFGKRRDIPALQCTDMLAWSCYQFALHKFAGTPLKFMAEQSFNEFEKNGLDDQEWLTAVTITRDHLKDWGERELNDPRGQLRRKEWLAAHPK